MIGAVSPCELSTLALDVSDELDRLSKGQSTTVHNTNKFCALIHAYEIKIEYEVGMHLRVVQSGYADPHHPFRKNIYEPPAQQIEDELKVYDGKEFVDFPYHPLGLALKTEQKSIDLVTELGLEMHLFKKELQKIPYDTKYASTLSTVMVRVANQMMVETNKRAGSIKRLA